MIHDIAHCKGTECPKKDKCYRHVAYVEAIREKLTMFTMFTNPPFSHGECEYFKPFNNGSKINKRLWKH